MLIKKEIVFVLLIILFPIVIFTLTVKFERFLPLPMMARQIIHSFFPEKDFSQPILIDKNFKLTEKGFSKEYCLNFKYYDSYWIGISSDKSNIPANYQFRGTIKIEFFHNNTLISEHTISSILRKHYAGKDLNHLSNLSLFHFEYPINNKFKNDIKIKLTVLEADLELFPYEDSLQLYIKAQGLY